MRRERNNELEVDIDRMVKVFGEKVIIKRVWKFKKVNDVKVFFWIGILYNYKNIKKFRYGVFIKMEEKKKVNLF